MAFHLRAFLHHLAEEIEKDVPDVLGLLKTAGVPVPARVGSAVEVGAGLVGQLTDDGTHVLVTPPAPSSPPAATEAAPSNVITTPGDPFAVHG
ncbi:MAG TPA: hypothetical protein VE261_01570 [Gaiellaceae bacterium]|jgi:hypothetical protein|nr:hypothetical protein [Gaiellaceae bacterium]